MIRTFISCAALAAATVSAQDSVVYEFDLVLTENQLIDQGISSRFDDLVVGTLGSLRIELDAVATEYPGFSAPNIFYYNVQSVDFSVDTVNTTGTPGAYPSQSFATAMMVTDNVLTAAPDTFTDQFGGFLSLADPDISLALILFNERGAFGSFPSLFTDTQLPSAAALSAAPNQSFFFQTSFNPAARINFGFTGISRTDIPTAPSLCLVAIAGISTLRRRR